MQAAADVGMPTGCGKLHTSSKRTHRGPVGRLGWQRPRLHLPLILLLPGSIALLFLLHLSSTTDEYEPARRWYAFAQFLPVCARCSRGHTGGASAAVAQADPLSLARRVGGPPRVCHPHRKRGSGSLAGPTVHLDAPLSPEDEPADLAETGVAGTRPQPGPARRERGCAS